MDRAGSGLPGCDEEAIERSYSGQPPIDGARLETSLPLKIDKVVDVPGKELGCVSISDPLLKQSQIALVVTPGARFGVAHPNPLDVLIQIDKHGRPRLF
jgi:hypothetical protein